MNPQGTLHDDVHHHHEVPLLSWDDSHDTHENLILNLNLNEHGRRLLLTWTWPVR